MKITFKLYSLLIFALIITSFNDQNQGKSNASVIYTSSTEQLKTDNEQAIELESGVNFGYLDKKGILWFGSFGEGVYSYDGNSFKNYTEDDGLCNNQVYSLIEDNEGILWFGTQNGLCRYDRKTFTHLPIPFSDTTGVWLDKVYPVISPNAVYSLREDKKGNLWIGTGGVGIYRYDGKTFTSFLSEIGRKQEDSLYHNWVPSITEDTQGNLWFASMTHGGVNRYDGENFTQFMPKDGLSDDMVRTSFEDREGNVWFGFNGNRNSGLTFYNGRSFTTFPREDGLCNTNIRGIYEDKSGNLWLGSGRGNLCIFDGKTFSEFTTKEGQSFEGVLFIIEDAKKNIWFGGSNGLWRFDGETITDMTK